MTISIAINPDGTPNVSYTGPGLSNGICSESNKSSTHSSSSSSSAKKKGETPENLYSTVPPELEDLVGARAGQAQGDLESRGYTHKNTVTWDGGKSAYYV